MNKKDIEDFLRRSNSISDQSPLEDSEVPIRRMSLKEFSGLDPSNKEQIAELNLVSWKKSFPASLINTYSARRRSVLSTDASDSPSRRLSAPREESIDIASALDKVTTLRQTLAEASHVEATSINAEDGGYGERKRLLEDAKNFSLILKDAGDLDVHKIFEAAAEITDAAETLVQSAFVVISTGSVYQSQLVATELNQVLASLHAFLLELHSLQDLSHTLTFPVRHHSQLSSAANQLVLAVTALN